MSKKYKIGLFPMCADLLHAGHIFALEEASNNCEYLIVALNTYPDGKRPIQSVYERYTQLKAVKHVYDVIPYQGRVDMELIASSLNYDVRFVGEDYRDKDWDGKKQEERRGIPACFLSRSHSLSSTNLKQRIVECVGR